MKTVSGTEVEKIHTAFCDEYSRLKTLLPEKEKIDIDQKDINDAVEKCIITLRRFKTLEKLE